MNAIKEIRKYLEKDPTRESAQILARLTAALAEERTFPLGDLYRLNYDEFQMALDLMKDWRLDRYYASRVLLFDVVVNSVLPQDNGRS